MKERDEACGARRRGRAISGRFDHGTVIAYLALFVALGGVAVAANTVPKNSVVTDSIRNGAVTAPKLGCKGNSRADKMVKAGPVRIDKYEASIWTSRRGGTQITGEVPCDPNGQDCDNIFARSVAGVIPAADITWFQAQQALANSGKRLPTNAEWQQAVAGTPDSLVCNVGDEALVANTGSHADCVSRFGARDMVGNVSEWVADWDEEAGDCTTWPADFGSDITCFGDGTPSSFPAALHRGGGVEYGQSAGPFAAQAEARPSHKDYYIGFRGAR